MVYSYIPKYSIVYYLNNFYFLLIFFVIYVYFLIHNNNYTFMILLFQHNWHSTDSSEKLFQIHGRQCGMGKVEWETPEFILIMNSWIAKKIALNKRAQSKMRSVHLIKSYVIVIMNRLSNSQWYKEKIVE